MQLKNQQSKQSGNNSEGGESNIVFCAITANVHEHLAHKRAQAMKNRLAIALSRSAHRKKERRVRGNCIAWRP
jgi:hypothetical protein